MASYHFSVQVVKRSEGRSAVAMAAYRSGEKLKDERRALDVDFRRRRGVVHAEIMAPQGAAGWLLDREMLWNGVERMETRRDAQLAREINMALPHELSPGEQLELVRAFVREQFVALGMVADIAIHAPVAEKGDDPRNFHAHVMLTMRQAGGGGLRRVKTREWNSDKLLARWREAWAARQNELLRSRGLSQRLDHRSLALQRREALDHGDTITAAVLERKPEVHVGPAARVRPRFEVSARLQRAGSRGPVRTRHGKAEAKRVETVRTLCENVRCFGQRILKAEQRLGRARALLMREEQTHEPPVRPSRCVRWSPAPSLLAPKRHGGRVLRKTHLTRRRVRLLKMMSQLERLLLALLRIREDQLLRHSRWAPVLVGRRLMYVDLGLGRGRHRELWPMEVAIDRTFPTK